MATDLNFEAIVQLTAQTDAEHLHSCFASIVNSLFPKTIYRLYENKLPAQSGNYELLFDNMAILSCSASHYSGDEKIMNAIIDENFSDTDMLESTTVYPILVRQLHFGFLFLSGSNLDDIAANTLLSHYLSIYANQLNLLRTNNHDALTGLLNRQTFNGSLDKLLNQMVRTHRRNADNKQQAEAHYFAMLDIDHFKRLNDKFGHLIGDETLLHVAQIMQQSFRDDDMLFRYGGEEFAIILRNVDKKNAHLTLERFRKTITETLFPQVSTVTISIGFTQICSNLLISSIIQQADKALYEAKATGRNKVLCYENLVAEKQIEVVSDNANDIELF